jgi:uncharacterized membrane protein YfcA
MSTFLLVAIVTVAAFAQGLTGFGFGLVAMALLPLFMDFKDAVALVAVLNLLVCAATFLSTRRHVVWRRVASLAVASALGVPLGVWALVRWDARWLLGILGAWMIAFAISELLLARWWRPRFPEWSGWPVGLMSGALGGAFNAGGPPAIAYVYSQPWSKEETVAALQVVFGASAVVRVALMGGAGLMPSELLTVFAASALPVLGGIALGARLLRRVPPNALKVIAAVFFLAMGAKYLLAP